MNDETKQVLSILLTRISAATADAAHELNALCSDAPAEATPCAAKEAEATKAAVKKKAPQERAEAQDTGNESYDKARDILESEEGDEPTDILESEEGDEPTDSDTPSDVRELGKNIQQLIKAGLVAPVGIREALNHVGAKTVANIEKEELSIVWAFFAEAWALLQEGE